MTLVDRLRAAIEGRRALAEPGAGESWEVGREDGDGGWQIPGIVGAGYEGGGVWSREDADHIVANQPSTVTRRCKADLDLLDEHAVYWRTVEWPHDQNGKGEAMCCRSCENADSTEWNPPVGQAGVLPEGFVAKYVVAPCRTIVLLAEGYGIAEEET